MKRTKPLRASAGLTLIELMVALAVFAVLGVLSYRALSMASLSQGHLDESFRRWNGLARAMSRVETELFEIVVPKNEVGSRPSAALRLVRGADGELDFLRLDAGRGVRRAGFRLRDQKLEWLLWEGREASGNPQVETLLDNVRDLRWRFIAGGQRLDAWPPESASPGGLPAAVVVEIDLPDLGSYNRVFTLR